MILFDIEANGLLEDSTEIWCISGMDINIEEEKERLTYEKKKTIWGEGLTAENVEAFFSTSDYIIGHNIIGYDVPMLEKYFPGCGILQKNPIDTYTLSKLANADRLMPPGCPHGIWNPLTGKTKKIGPHGLESWGYRVAHQKPTIHDWTVFDEGILNRCEEDVHINFLAMKIMLKELNVSLKDISEQNLIIQT